MLKFEPKFMTLLPTDQDFQIPEPNTPFEPKTEITSEIKAGEMFTGEIDPTDPPKKKDIEPSFSRGRYGFHLKNLEFRRSRHWKLKNLPPKQDLMGEIMLELSKYPKRYSTEKLPPILQKQFGRARRVHKEKWIDFKKQYEILNKQSVILEAS